MNFGDIRVNKLWTIFMTIFTDLNEIRINWITKTNLLLCAIFKQKNIYKYAVKKPPYRENYPLKELKNKLLWNKTNLDKLFNLLTSNVIAKIILFWTFSYGFIKFRDPLQHFLLYDYKRIWYNSALLFDAHHYTSKYLLLIFNEIEHHVIL